MLSIPPLFRRGGKGEIAFKKYYLFLRRERVRVRAQCVVPAKAGIHVGQLEG